MTEVSQMLDSGRPALLSRRWDFWLLGGASLVLWIPFALLAPAGPSDWVQAVVTLSAIDLLVNQPHLLASYHLAYGRGREFILRHWFHTLLVPLGLLLTFAWAFWLLMQPDTPAESAAAVMGGAVNFMFLVSGWHFTKQAFGVTMVCANYEGYPLTRWQRELMRYSLLTLWWYSFACGPGGPRRVGPYSLQWNQSFPHWLAPLLGWVLAALTLGVVVGVFARRRPGLNVLAPYCSVFLWFIPWLRPYAYYQLAPVFHGLQYLPFVYRVERFRNPALARHLAWLGLVGLMAIGWMVMRTIPESLDGWAAGKVEMISFFLVSAGVFCNVHHIFLDNVLWRIGEDKELRQALLP